MARITPCAPHCDAERRILPAALHGLALPMDPSASDRMKPHRASTKMSLVSPLRLRNPVSSRYRATCLVERSSVRSSQRRSARSPLGASDSMIALTAANSRRTISKMDADTWLFESAKILSIRPWSLFELSAAKAVSNPVRCQTSRRVDDDCALQLR